MGIGKSLGPHFGRKRRIIFQLIHQAEMQMSPFPHDVLLIVAVMPAVQTVLRRERRRTTGSRTGFVGALRVVVPGPGGTTQEIDGSQFYDARFWDPVRYQAWHDSTWARPRIGRVTVGELEDADGSRIPPPDGGPQP